MVYRLSQKVLLFIEIIFVIHVLNRMFRRAPRSAIKWGACLTRVAPPPERYRWRERRGFQTLSLAMLPGR